MSAENKTTELAKLHAMPKVKETAFIALFAGARSEIHIFSDKQGNREAPTWGKAECEWVEDWHGFYFRELVELGWMEPMMIEHGICKGGHLGTTFQVWRMRITERGHDVRDAWWAEWKLAVDERTTHDAA